jgi:hypothetical protein
MRRMVRCSAVVIAVAACGGHNPAPQQATFGGAPVEDEPRLEPAIAGQQWYRAQSTCAQGPFEVELPASGSEWGEEFELRLATPRAVALHAQILVDGQEAESVDSVFRPGGQPGGGPDNARCIADARERLVLGRTGSGGGTTGTPGKPGTLVVPPPDRPRQTAQLELQTDEPPQSFEVLKVSLHDRPAGARIRVRFWSIEPNDLEGVRFGFAHIEWRPNVSVERYRAYLTFRADQEERRRQAALVVQAPPVRVAMPAPTVVVKVDVEAERKAELKRIEDERRAEKKRIEAELRAEEARRRRAIDAALEQERRLRREAFCAAHHGDRSCWGAGGFAIHAEFERHRDEARAYCAAHPEDARCWTGEEQHRRSAVWNARVEAALAPPKQPDGPPPDPIAEDIPPKLSAHAEWRAGYWQWTAGTWVWLAGMWRVPDDDIASEQTTTAPSAPPPPQPEVAPAAPVAVAVWVPGFWQWNGTSWVWISGSYQLRPEPRVSWRVPEWRARGNVHVLIPGGWVRIGGGR